MAPVLPPPAPAQIAEKPELIGQIEAIVGELNADAIPVPEGARGALDLEAEFIHSAPSEKSERIERSLKQVVGDIPYLDRAWVRAGTVCRGNICQVVGRFDETAPNANSAVAADKLQSIPPELLHQAGLNEPSLIEFKSGRAVRGNFFRMFVTTKDP